MIHLTDNQFHINRTWQVPLDSELLVPIQDPALIEIFDQNGYRLTNLEHRYAETNNHPIVQHRHEICLRQDWFTDSRPLTGPHLNHAFLFERKGYEGEALEQLHRFTKDNHLVYKLINYRGKWGVDLSIDYVDEVGNSMEILHFEYDGYYYSEIAEMKHTVEELVKSVDFDFAAKKILDRKQEWINLAFFDQSKWKTDFFNLPVERFKILAWE